MSEYDKNGLILQEGNMRDIIFCVGGFGWGVNKNQKPHPSQQRRRMRHRY
jgi:hypothetical protein